MRSEAEIRSELEVAFKRMLHCREHKFIRDFDYYHGYVEALKWVLEKKR